MYTQRFTRAILISLLLSLPGWGQQTNGRNYTAPTLIVGNNQQWGNDSGVDGAMLTVPAATGAIAPKAWGLFHVLEVAADTAGTNHHGVALYNSSGTLLCSVYTTRTVAIGDNTYAPSGCGTPSASTSYTLAYLTDWSGDAPGSNAGASLSALTCPGTASFSSFASETAFPGTLPGLSAQGFCYTFWVDEVLAGGSNGKFYGGNAGLTSGIRSIPTGPWGNNGNWYGGLNSANTFVSFSDGLTNATLPTTTALGNSTHGTSCTWNLETANTVIAGSTSGHLNLLTPVTVSSANYGGAATTPLTFQYTGSASRNAANCVLGSSFGSLSAGFHLKTDVPITDPQDNSYDSGALSSSDTTDRIIPSVVAGGGSINFIMECEGAPSLPPNMVPISPNVNYWIWIQKNTGGATQFEAVFNQDNQGSLVGIMTCPSESGTHNANTVTTPITGSETNTTGAHVWVDTYEISTSGAFLTP